MNRRYVILAVAVVIVIVAGGFLLSGIEFAAPTKSVEIVIPDARFAQ